MSEQSSSTARITALSVAAADFITPVQIVDSAERLFVSGSYKSEGEFHPLIQLLSHIATVWRPNVYSVYLERLGIGTVGDVLRELEPVVTADDFRKVIDQNGEWLTSAWWNREDVQRGLSFFWAPSYFTPDMSALSTIFSRTNATGMVIGLDPGVNNATVSIGGELFSLNPKFGPIKQTPDQESDLFQLYMENLNQAFEDEAKEGFPSMRRFLGRRRILGDPKTWPTIGWALAGQSDDASDKAPLQFDQMAFYRQRLPHPPIGRTYGLDLVFLDDMNSPENALFRDERSGRLTLYAPVSKVVKLDDVTDELLADVMGLPPAMPGESKRDTLARVSSEYHLEWVASCNSATRALVVSGQLPVHEVIGAQLIVVHRPVGVKIRNSGISGMTIPMGSEAKTYMSKVLAGFLGKERSDHPLDKLLMNQNESDVNPITELREQAIPLDAKKGRAGMSTIRLHPRLEHGPISEATVHSGEYGNAPIFPAYFTTRMVTCNAYQIWSLSKEGLITPDQVEPSSVGGFLLTYKQDPGGLITSHLIKIAESFPGEPRNSDGMSPSMTYQMVKLLMGIQDKVEGE
jgi:hypothetical protein